jgi:hypothetical protein
MIILPGIDCPEFSKKTIISSVFGKLLEEFPRIFHSQTIVHKGKIK